MFADNHGHYAGYDDDLFEASDPDSSSHAAESNDSEEMGQFKLDSSCLETSLASHKRVLEPREAWPRVVSTPSKLTVTLSCFQHIYGGMLVKSLSSIECFDRLNTLTLAFSESLYPWRDSKISTTYGRGKLSLIVLRKFPLTLT